MYFLVTDIFETIFIHSNIFKIVINLDYGSILIREMDSNNRQDGNYFRDISNKCDEDVSRNWSEIFLKTKKNIIHQKLNSKNPGVFELHLSSILCHLHLFQHQLTTSVVKLTTKTDQIQNFNQCNSTKCNQNFNQFTDMAASMLPESGK